MCNDCPEVDAIIEREAELIRKMTGGRILASDPPAERDDQREGKWNVEWNIETEEYDIEYERF